MKTRKDYQKAADIIRLNDFTGSQKEALISVFIEFFRGDNPRFDENRFQDACFKGK